MIKLKIIYFGMIAEATGLQQEELIFSENLLEMLDRALQKKYPQIATLNYQFAVNKSIEREDFKLTDGDEIALLPPFAGG